MNCKDAQRVWGHTGGFFKGLNEVFPGITKRLHEIAKNLVDGKTNPFNDAVHRKVAGKVRDGIIFYVEHGDDNDPLVRQMHDVLGDEAARGMLEEHISNCPSIRPADIGLLHPKPQIQIVFGNICCGGCEASIGDLTLEEKVTIQNAAIRTNPDGSDIDI